MPTQDIVSTLDEISTGLLIIGASALVLSLACGGLAVMFAWFDTHAGGLIKRILLSAIGGSAIMGGSGAIGKWLAAKFALAGAAPAAVAMVNQAHVAVLALAAHLPLLPPLG